MIGDGTAAREHRPDASDGLEAAADLVRPAALSPHTAADLIFDADSHAAISAFNLLMQSFDLSCNLIVETSKGEHYYFRRAAGTLAKSDSHATAEHPERLDIKTGRALVVLPPSTGKSILIREAENASDLVEVEQDFIDAVYRHNGREAPGVPPASAVVGKNASSDEVSLVAKLRRLLPHIDPDDSYDDWLHTGMAIHHEFGGNDAGFDMFDTWSG